MQRKHYQDTINDAGFFQGVPLWFASAWTASISRRRRALIIPNIHKEKKMLKKPTPIMTMAMIMTAAFLFAGCAPKADPVMVGKVNALFGAKSTATYKGSGKFKPVPYAVGQFVTHGNTENTGKRSVSRTAIIGKERNGWIIETYSINESSESCSQMLVVGLDTMQSVQDFENLDILWVKMKDENGQIQTIEGPPLMMAKGFYKSALKSFNMSALTNQGSGEDITVPAGTFTNTFNADAEVSIMGMTFRSKSWFCDKVPVNGMVKSVTDDGKVTTELLSFGNSGAKSCF